MAVVSAARAQIHHRARAARMRERSTAWATAKLPNLTRLICSLRPFGWDVSDVLDLPAAPGLDRRGHVLVRDARPCGLADGCGQAGPRLAHGSTLDCFARHGRSAFSPHRDLDGAARPQRRAPYRHQSAAARSATGEPARGARRE